MQYIGLRLSFFDFINKGVYISITILSLKIKW